VTDRNDPEEFQRAIDAARERLGKAKDATPDGAVATAPQLTNGAKRNLAPIAAAALFVAGFLAGRASRR